MPFLCGLALEVRTGPGLEFRCERTGDHVRSLRSLPRVYTVPL